MTNNVIESTNKVFKSYVKMGKMTIERATRLIYDYKVMERNKYEQFKNDFVRVRRLEYREQESKIQSVLSMFWYGKSTQARIDILPRLLLHLGILKNTSVNSLHTLPIMIQ